MISKITKGALPSGAPTSFHHDLRAPICYECMAMRNEGNGTITIDRRIGVLSNSFCYAYLEGPGKAPFYGNLDMVEVALGLEPSGADIGTPVLLHGAREVKGKKLAGFFGPVWMLDLSERDEFNRRIFPSPDRSGVIAVYGLVEIRRWG